MLERARTILALAFVSVTLACASAPVAPDAPVGYAALHDAWRAERLAELRAPRGWLALAGFTWLREGVATLGSEPGNTILLTPTAPGRVGTLTRTGSRYQLVVRSDVIATCGGRRVTERDLASDVAGPSDVIEVGPVSFAVIVRGGDPAVRVWDSSLRSREAQGAIPSWPLDPAWRLVGRFVPFPEPREVPVSTAIATTETGRATGEIRFTLDGREQTVTPLVEEGSPGFFLVFGDTTNGVESYGGGRFLDVDPPDAEGRVVLDFNRAINPPCAFTAYATCPLPRPENRLPVAVTAGEQRVD